MSDQRRGAEVITDWYDGPLFSVTRIEFSDGHAMVELEGLAVVGAYGPKMLGPRDEVRVRLDIQNLRDALACLAGRTVRDYRDRYIETKAALASTSDSLEHGRSEKTDEELTLNTSVIANSLEQHGRSEKTVDEELTLNAFAIVANGGLFQVIDPPHVLDGLITTTERVYIVAESDLQKALDSATERRASEVYETCNGTCEPQCAWLTIVARIAAARESKERRAKARQAKAACRCYGCAKERASAGVSEPDRSDDPCEPSNACERNGNCWTHSTWDV